MTLPAMHYEWLFLTKTVYDPEVFWVMVTALATVILVLGTFVLAITSYLPLVRARQEEAKAAKAQVAERLRQELQNPSTQKLFFLASHGFLKFVTSTSTPGKTVPYFEIMQIEPNILMTRLTQIAEGQQIFMTFEVDDRILNPLQEVAHFEKINELEFKDAFRIFGDHIDVCFKSPAIRDYIIWLRNRVGNRFYVELEELQRRIEISVGRRSVKDGPILPEVVRPQAQS